MNCMISCKAIEVDSAYLAGEGVGLRSWGGGGRGGNIFGMNGRTNTGHYNNNNMHTISREPEKNRDFYGTSTEQPGGIKTLR